MTVGHVHHVVPAASRSRTPRALLGAGVAITLAGVAALVVATFLDWYRFEVDIPGVPAQSFDAWAALSWEPIVLVVLAALTALGCVAAPVLSRRSGPLAWAPGPAVLLLGLAIAGIVAYRLVEEPPFPPDAGGIGAELDTLFQTSLQAGGRIALAGAGLVFVGGALQWIAAALRNDRR